MELKFQSYNKIDDVIKRSFSRNMLTVTDMSEHDITAKTYLKYYKAKLLKNGYIGGLS